MDRAQRVDLKNGVIFLVILYIHKVVAMSKMAQFLYFLFIKSKNYFLKNSTLLGFL